MSGFFKRFSFRRGRRRGPGPHQIVVAEITQYPTERARPEGRVTHILGYPDDPEVEPEIIIHKYDLPHRFTSAALKEAQHLPSTPSFDETRERVDLREITTFTIDGENARDFDDAVSIEKEKMETSNSMFHLRCKATMSKKEPPWTKRLISEAPVSIFQTELSNVSDRALP